MLNKGTFINERFGYTVKAGSSSLLIISYSTCIIKGILNRQNREKANLELTNIIVIKGFYINIIFKAILYKKGV